MKDYNEEKSETEVTLSDPFDEEEDFQSCCVICGEPNCVDACVCGAPLCHMHFELGAGFCNDRSKEHQLIVENAYKNMQ